MNIKFLLIAVIYTASLNTVRTENESISCEYRLDAAKNYACALSVNNPTGRNDFTSISGTHLPGKTNNDVVSVHHTAPSASSTAIVPRIICDQFPSTIVLWLRALRIRSTDENSFAKCTQLKNLHLAGDIAELHENSFSQNKELDLMYLNENQLTTLPENIFAQQQKLVYLNLNGNRFSDLPDNTFKGLKSLKVLMINTNRLTTLKTQWFADLENLDTITLSGNLITQIPLNLFVAQKSLKNVQFNLNALERIDSRSFGNLKNLRVFSATNNRINAIDRKFYENAENLDVLFLSNNLCSNDDFVWRNEISGRLDLCFENFEHSPGNCTVGGLEERVCILENENIQIKEQIRELQSRIPAGTTPSSDDIQKKFKPMFF